MRTLCLSLPKFERPSAAETFLAFTPRVHYRAPGLVFLDVGATARKFGGEAGLLHEVQRLTGEFFPGATAALADTPATAQLFSRVKPFSIVAPDTETKELQELPLSTLIHLEGLVAWRTPREIENVIDFFYALGIQSIGDLRRFSSATLSERFGATGTVLWRRLHGLDKQVISPLIPADPLTETIHFDFGVSLLPLLLHSIEKSLLSLLARLQGRHQTAGKVLLHLHCEHGQRYHLVELLPFPAPRLLPQLMNLIEDQFVNLDLENPIKQLFLEIIPRPLTDTASVLNDLSRGEARMTSGFLLAKNVSTPETPWKNDPIEFADMDEIEDDEHVLIGEHNLRLKPRLSQAHHAPTLSTTFSEPMRLSRKQLVRYKFLSTLPVEMVEDSGWETSRGRQYYMALTPAGEPCWIYHDRLENEHYQL